MPGGFTRATWSWDGGELILLSPAEGRLVRFSKEGRPLGSIVRPGQGAEDFPNPSQLHALASGFVVRSSAYRWVWLDRQFKPVRGLIPTIRPPFNMIDEVLSGERVAGFGSAKTEAGPYAFGFLRGTLRPMALERLVAQVSLETKAGSLYTQLFPLVAEAGGRAYGLWFGEPSSILDLVSGVQLKAFPKGFAVLPSLPRSDGQAFDRAGDLVLEKSALTTSIYGQGRYLYLLTRQPEKSGRTTWKLHRIDPVNDRLLASFVLPTVAAHLVVVPGPESWALIEKSSGSSPATTANLRTLMIDRHWFEGAGDGKGEELRCP